MTRTAASSDASAVHVTGMRRSDWEQVAAIYAAGIATGDATFETLPPTWEVFDAAKLSRPRLVARSGSLVVGWAAVAPVSARPVYAGVVEHSVFVHSDHRGHGIGALLLHALLDDAESAGIWTIQSHVFPENLASLALHARLGFREVGRRERLGRMETGPRAGQWRDVVLIEHRRERD